MSIVYTHEQKISHLQTLYHLAHTDGEIGQEEKIYIKVVADRLGIPLEILEHFDGGEPDLILPDREYKLYSLFHRLAIIIMVDGFVHEQEERTCFDLGIKMGLHPNAIDEIIKHVTIKNSDESPGAIISIFKKYLN